MLEKGEAEQHSEQFQFAACKQLCEDTTVERKRARLTKEIAEHEADIAVWTH